MPPLRGGGYTTIWEVESMSSELDLDTLYQNLFNEYKTRMPEEAAKRKAKLDIKRLQITSSTPRQLVFISKGEWLENNGNEVLPMRFYDPSSKTIKTVWNRSSSPKLEALEPLTIIEVIARGDESLSFDDVSSSSVKVKGTFNPVEFRKSLNYKPLKELVGKDTGFDRVITEGDVLFPPKELSNGNKLFKVTDINSDLDEVFAVFVSPAGVIEEIGRDDRILIIGSVRYNEGNLLGGCVINADLVVRVPPYEEE